MPFVNGTWIDDATSVPDPSMPAGMGDPTGAIVPATQPPPMVPQQINPRPMLGGPPPAPALTPSAVDTMGNPLQAPPIPPPITDPQVGQQIRQGFQQLDRPSMSPGNLAATILKAPLTVPMGIIEELRGLLGGDTIEGWAQQARSRYGDPNFTESRAFGVRGAAEEPAFGDRFTGVVTGSAQRGAMAGKILRQQIGEYNANRKAALQETRDVQQLQLGDVGLRRNLFKEEQERKYLDLKNRLQVQTSQLGLQNTQQQMRAREIQISKLQIELGITREEAESLVQQNEIFNTPGPSGGFPARGLTGPAANIPGLLPSTVNKLQEVERNALGSQQADVNLLRSQPVNPSLQTGPEVAAAAAVKAENDRKAAAAAADDRARDLGITQKAVDAAFEARAQKVTDPLLPFGLSGPSAEDQLENLRVEKALLDADIAAGKINMAEAILRASALPTNTPISAATPVPGTTPTPSALVDRIGMMSPADKAAEIAQREAEAVGAPAVPGLRPTPMATPRPPGTTNFVDLNKAPPEATRQRDAKNEAAANEEFLLNWVMHEGWNSPRTGPRFENMKAAFMAKKGL